MYKFLITQTIKPGTLQSIIDKAKPCQKATRAEAGCISYDFYSSFDKQDELVFVECFKDKDAHAWHNTQPYVAEFLAFFRPLVVASKFEIVPVAE